MKQEIKQKAQSAKAHIRENKRVYLAAAGGVLLGAAAAVLCRGEARITTDSFKFQWKSPTTNNVTTVLPRRGHPGNIVLCNETGIPFSSQNQAADMMGLSKSNISKHLKGEQASVGGYTFTSLGEAQ